MPQTDPSCAFGNLFAPVPQVAQRLRQLFHREDTIMQLPLFERKIFNPAEAHAHAGQLTTPWCIHIGRLFQEHDRFHTPPPPSLVNTTRGTGLGTL